MRIGSLFAGVGGLELGLERAGLWPTVWQVEKDPYASKVLAKHWPEAKRFDDVCTVGAHNLEPVDLICGGFPCTDLSVAGRKAGLEGRESGLWFEFERVVGEMRPAWVVVENIHHAWRKWVPVVRRAFWALGYTSVPLRLSAADVGAWHRRRRVFVLAHADGANLRLLARRWSGTGRQEAAQPQHDGRWPGPPRVQRAPDGLPYGVDRNRCIGNAVVPAQGEAIGRAIIGATP